MYPASKTIVNTDRHSCEPNYLYAVDCQAVYLNLLYYLTYLMVVFTNNPRTGVGEQLNHLFTIRCHLYVGKN